MMNRPLLYPDHAIEGIAADGVQTREGFLMQFPDVPLYDGPAFDTRDAPETIRIPNDVEGVSLDEIKRLCVKASAGAREGIPPPLTPATPGSIPVSLRGALDSREEALRQARFAEERETVRWAAEVVASRAAAAMEERLLQAPPPSAVENPDEKRLNETAVVDDGRAEALAYILKLYAPKETSR